MEYELNWIKAIYFSKAYQCIHFVSSTVIILIREDNDAKIQTEAKQFRPVAIVSQQKHTIHLPIFVMIILKKVKVIRQPCLHDKI